jgi:hypothetical protein
MLGFPIALITANAFEWYAHKMLLHEYPRKHRNSPFFTHIRHHKHVRLHGFHDQNYHETMWQNQEVFLEKAMLIGAAGVFTPLLPVAPFFVGGVYYSAWRYWYVHSRCHLDPDYARARIPWHYDHHMNVSEEANWCVTRPWFDYIMGTRVIGDSAIAETNPLGMKLPGFLEKGVNQLARRLLSSARIREAGDKERVASRQQNEALSVPGVACNTMQ